MDTTTRIQKEPRKTPIWKFSTPMRTTKINPDLITRFLTTNIYGRSITCFDELESTNFSARELAKVGYPHGTLVVCDHQISGRGRRERKWVSIPEESVCMSLILRPAILPCYVPRYTIAAAVSICRAMRMYCMHDVRIKWPNDIVIGERKLAGILMDCSMTSDRVKYLITGIGLNVNTAKFFGDLLDHAVSIFQCTGVHINRERVIANILNEAEAVFEMCETDEGFAELMKQYCEMSAVLKRRVRIITATGNHIGLVTGFDEMGRILISLDDGSVQVFDSGDVSLRSEAPDTK